MNNFLRHSAAFGCAVAVSAGSTRAAEPRLDAVVETSSGASAHLSALFARPSVLFYEDRDSTPVNQHVKDALFARGKSRGLLDSVEVVAVANVAAFDWFPARNFVLAAVKDVEAKVHVPVYLDFKGALAAPPWGLPARNSTVLVLSRDGQVVWKHQGRLSDADVEALFAALEAQLGG